MQDLLTYVWEASLCLVLFWVLYFLVFSHLRFHAWNRFYLLASLALSLIIPLPLLMISPESLGSWISYVPMPRSPETIPDEELMGQSLEKEGWSFMFYLILIYGLGLVFWSIRLTYHLFILLQKIRTGNREAGYVFCQNSPGKGNSSFFNLIFLSTDKLNDAEYEQVVQHEKTHYTLGHSWDLLLLSLVQVILWFHPVVYRVRHSLRLIHEYQVDARMIQEYTPRAYAQLLLKLGEAPGGWMRHALSQHPLKLRIREFYHPKSNPMKKLLYVLAIPLCLFACQQFAIDSESEEFAKLMKEEELKTSKEPLIILEGKVVTRDVLHTMDPQNIESIEVIKKDLQTWVDQYGTTAVNGVVIIHCKEDDC